MDVQTYDSFNFPLTSAHRLGISVNTMPIQGLDDAYSMNSSIAEGGRLKKKTLEQELETMYGNRKSSTIVSGIILIYFLKWNYSHGVTYHR